MPQLRFLALPAPDTLWLNPLAFPCYALHRGGCRRDHRPVAQRDSKPEYLDQLRCEHWEVILPELIFALDNPWTTLGHRHQTFR